MRRKHLISGVVVGSLVAAQSASAAVLAEYTFSPATNPPTHSSVATNVTASNVSGGSQSVVGPSNNFYTSAPFITVNRNGDTAANAYFQVTIAAAAGYELDMTSFSFDGAKGGASGPRTYDLHSSVAGLTLTDPTLVQGEFTYTRPASNGVMPTFSFPLGAAYQNLATLTMRVYFYTPGVSQNIDVDNIVFQGDVSAVPEPAAATAGVALMALRRRRR